MRAGESSSNRDGAATTHALAIKPVIKRVLKICLFIFSLPAAVSISPDSRALCEAL
jgi:hypothetical protein